MMWLVKNNSYLGLLCQLEADFNQYLETISKHEPFNYLMA